MLEELSFEDQVSVVANARFIVAEQGAGLAHIVFSAPGTTVAELLSPYWRNPLYGSLSHRLGLAYSAIVGSPLRARPANRPTLRVPDYPRGHLRLELVIITVRSGAATPVPRDLRSSSVEARAGKPTRTLASPKPAALPRPSGTARILTSNGASIMMCL